MTTILAHLYRHNCWANLAMFGACRDLAQDQLDRTVEGTYGSLGDTLLHLAKAEAGYTHHLTGAPRLIEREAPFPGVAALIDVLERTGSALEEVAESLEPTRQIRIESIERGDKDFPAFVILLQAVNHATDHRSQIATILTQLGIEVPDLDLWSWDEAGLSRT